MLNYYDINLYIKGVDGPNVGPDLTWKVEQKSELIQWLSEQSDYSMSGGDPNSKLYGFGWVNNQTITEKSMREFVHNVDNGRKYMDPFK